MSDESAVKMRMTTNFLQVITETQVLYPHKVTKCSQLDLVLINIKGNNLKWFCYNLCVSPNTFDDLVKMSEGYL
jgi:hypothetical protein